MTKPIVDSYFHRRTRSIEKSQKEDSGARLLFTDVPAAIDVRRIFVENLHGQFFFEVFLQTPAADGHRPEEIVENDGELFQVAVVQLTEFDDLLFNTIGVIEKHLLGFVRPGKLPEQFLRQSHQTIETNLRNLSVVGLVEFECVNLRVLIILLQVEFRTLVPRLQVDLSKGLFNGLRKIETKLLLLEKDAHITLLPRP